MQALQEELYNENWLFAFPNISQINEINTFDDGNEKYEKYNNKFYLFVNTYGIFAGICE